MEAKRKIGRPKGSKNKITAKKVGRPLGSKNKIVVPAAPKKLGRPRKSPATNLYRCGCKEPIKEGRLYVRGHQLRARTKALKTAYKLAEQLLELRNSNAA